MKTLSRQRLSQTWHNSYRRNDVWYDLNDLFTDHIEEVMEKWDTIDDQIWAKVVVMEKNRRVSKMFLHKSEMVVTNEEMGYDISGRIGLRGFDNKMRDAETETILKRLGKGCRLWLDCGGNIWIKNLSRAMECHSAEEFSGVSSEVKTSRKLFDVNKFKSEIRKLSKTNSAKPLAQQTVSIVKFGESREDLLDQPLWLVVINIVALDFMKSKLGLDIMTAASDRLKSEDDEEEMMGHPISWHGLHPERQ